VSATAAAVWQLCDGTRTEVDLIAAAGVTPEDARCALDQLEAAGLLERAGAATGGVSRRMQRDRGCVPAGTATTKRLHNGQL
jgi:hypothetical protein